MAFKLSDFMGEIASIIREIDMYILKVQKSISDSISAIFNGTATFTDYYDAAMVLLINAVGAYIALSISLWEGAASSFIGKARVFIATIVDSIPAQILFATHNMLTAVWWDYRLLFEGINNAAAGLSSSLGYSMEFLPLALHNLQNIFTATFALAGWDVRKSEIVFLDHWANFLDKWNSNFDRYARNPGAIMDDIQEWANLYALAPLTAIGEATAREVADLNDLVQEKIAQIDELEESVNTLIVDLPEENFSKVQEWYAPIHKEITDFQDTYVTPALDYLNTIVGILEEHAEKTDLTWAEFMDLMANWPDVMSGIYFDASDVGTWRKNLFDYLIGKAGALSNEEQLLGIQSRLEATIKPPAIPVPEPLQVEPYAPSPRTVTPISVPPLITGSIYETILAGVSDSGGTGIANQVKGNI